MNQHVPLQNASRQTAIKRMNRITLNDRALRDALRTKLSTLATPPKAILEEVRVHNGNAIADIVAVHRGLHCYEIKGESDKVTRIRQQGFYYDQAFQRITLVTTFNQYQSAMREAPEHWGIIVASTDRTAIRLKYARAARDNPMYDKYVALLTLWRNELAEGLARYQPGVSDKDSRHTLSQRLGSLESKNFIDSFIGEKLLSRHLTIG